MFDGKAKVRAFIIDNFLFGEEGRLGDDTSFLDEGVIDSTGVLELVAFLEEEFAVAIRDEELIPENLDSVRRVCSFLQRKQREGYLEMELPAAMRAGA